MIYGIFFLLCILSECLAENTIMYSKLGSSAILKCPLKSITETVIWRGPNDLTMYSIGQHMNEKIRRLLNIDVAGDFQSGEYNLVFSKYNNEHEGLYQCEIVANGKPVTHKIFLQTAVAPKIYIKVNNKETVSHRAFGYEGSSMTLDCTVNGKMPLANLSWRFHDEILSTNNSNLVSYTVNASRQIHLKDFKCVADNGFYVELRLIEIFIYFLPAVRVSAYPSNTVVDGNNITLDCVIDSNTEATTLQWIFNGHLLLDQDRHLLFLQNVKRQNAGRYICNATNVVGTSADSADVVVLYKPFPLQNTTKFTFEAEPFHLTNITIRIESLPEPSTSWAGTAGGKLGAWTIKKISLNVFAVSSTIVAENMQQIGLYRVVLRNSIGSLTLHVQLVQTSSLLRIFPKDAKCNVSESVTLQCSFDCCADEHTNLTWIHFVSDIPIRTIKGEIQGNTSLLEISFCDYRDTGTYQCKWITQKQTHIISANITVMAQPIYVSKHVLFGTDTIILKVIYYSIPESIAFTWFENDRPLPNETTKVTLGSSLVEMNFHEKKLMMNGFYVALNLQTAGFNSCPFSCQITNIYGSTDITFEKDYIDAAIKKSFTADNRFPIMFIYAGLTGIILVCLIIPVVKCIIDYLKRCSIRREALSTIEVNTTSGTQTNDAQPDNAQYEEIDDRLVYHDAERISDDSETDVVISNNLNITDSNNYLELHRTVEEIHEYKRCIESNI